MNEAVLKSTDGSIEVKFCLFPSSDQAWLNYTLHVEDANDAYDKELIADLSLLEREVNFLQRFPENELDILVEGITRVLNSEQERSSFSPIDERDFIFEISNSHKEHVKTISPAARSVGSLA